MATQKHLRAEDYEARVAEKLKLQKERLDKKIFELKKKLEAKEELELEIAKMKFSVETMLDLGEGVSAERQEQIGEVGEKLAAKEQELESLEELNGVLTAKERQSNVELQEARKVLINGLEGFDWQENVRTSEIASDLCVVLVMLLLHRLSSPFVSHSAND